MRFYCQTTVRKHPLYRRWTSGYRQNSCKQWSQTTVFNFSTNTERAVRMNLSPVNWLWRDSLFLNNNIPTDSRRGSGAWTLQQDLSLMSSSWSRDQDIKTFFLKTETKTKTSKSGLETVSRPRHVSRRHITGCFLRIHKLSKQGVKEYTCSPGLPERAVSCLLLRTLPTTHPSFRRETVQQQRSSLGWIVLLKVPFGASCPEWRSRAQWDRWLLTGNIATFCSFMLADEAKTHRLLSYGMLPFSTIFFRYCSTKRNNFKNSISTSVVGVSVVGCGCC